jgi:hypothetical protein
MGYFKNGRLTRMSDGHYCIIRDLGLVKGGKGMKHHEVLADFSFRGLARLQSRFARAVSRSGVSIRRAVARLTGFSASNFG